MVYYLYTSKITFAPLSSRKTNEVANEKKTDVPCVVTSPKSMYRLAKKLELNGLCDLAKAEIKSQISEDNIVEEVFSKFTSRHVEIREMELEFLFKHWDTMKSSAALRSMLLKQLPHTAVLVADIVTH
ncbi:hypothetical protein PLICRDRAFT_439586 [Plicaturopsis crispa FD-325 SS-3]|uniref:BTB domain-containing protein n=1 Tax=Plicaturopsis crispa FD-325 SS-3 TaxID=944288 RepID=A0A0C9T6P4_PLICR|nr:hypothetical protein PLICRDRAFT_439586 [Plicaturopsis crispa FD-325 SS-3]